MQKAKEIPAFASNFAEAYQALKKLGRMLASKDVTSAALRLEF